MDTVEDARRWFAEDLRHIGPIKSEAVTRAFATVPRECFLDPGPWTLIMPDGIRRKTADADPRHLYHNVLVPISARLNINNGEPRLWARLLDQVAIAPGEHVVHVGAGTGYYSAIMAELAGPSGRVTAIEVLDELAARAGRSLVAWPQATVLNGNGVTVPIDPADVIVVNAGVSIIAESWLDALKGGGRLLVPFTGPDRWGAFLMIVRTGSRYAVEYAGSTGIIPCVGGRNDAATARLQAALARSGFETIRSLRRAPETPDATCWLEGDGWWLSVA